MALELSKSTDLLYYTKEDVKKILAQYDRTEESISEDIAIIKKWLKTQLHLPEHPSDRQIASYLIKNKFYIKKAQEKIDMSYTIKSLIPDFYKNMYPTCPKIKDLVREMNFVILPKLSKKLQRIYIYRHIYDKEENILPTSIIALLIMNMELQMLYDISDGVVIILDTYKSTASGVAKITPMVLKKFLTVMEKVYSNRIYAFHLINIPSFLKTAFDLLKSMIKNELHEKFHFHHDYEELLCELYGKEVIPIEYGGTEKSCDELNENWMQFLYQHDDYFKHINSQFVNENLRPEKLKDDELLGYHGNFRTLNVD